MNDLHLKSAKHLFELLRQNEPLKIDMRQAQPQNCLTQTQLETANTNIGFEPPNLLVELYQEFGNGGFGMGYGLMGLGGGFTDDQGKTCDSFYARCIAGYSNDTSWEWPEKLLPICHFGCAIYACLDCNTQDLQVVIWDPNMWEPGTPPKLGCLRTEMGFVDYMRAWTTGVDLWNIIYGEDAIQSLYFSVD